MSHIVEWDAEHAKRSMFYAHPLEPTRKFFESIADHALNVLDIGCGQGTNALWLASKGFHVWGFDSSRSAIERLLFTATGIVADKRNVPRVLISDAAKHWPYSSNTFDIAFEIRVLENLTADDAQFAYKEVGRVLKPGGRFWCLTASDKREDIHTTVGKMRRTSDLELGEWLSAAGLQIEHLSREYETSHNGVIEDWNVTAVKVH